MLTLDGTRCSGILFSLICVIIDEVRILFQLYPLMDINKCVVIAESSEHLRE
jgi:hypothetical protein